jgi:hypothetical protein
VKRNRCWHVNLTKLMVIAGCGGCIFLTLKTYHLEIIIVFSKKFLKNRQVFLLKFICVTQKSWLFLDCVGISFSVINVLKVEIQTQTHTVGVFHPPKLCLIYIIMKNYPCHGIILANIQSNILFVCLLLSLIMF